MKFNLTLIVELTATLFHDLIILLSEESTLLAFPKCIPAEGVESVPQGIGCQPNRPRNLVGFYGRREKGLFSFGLAFENLRPDLVSETGLIIRLFIEVQIQQLFLPACGGRPTFRLIV